MVDRPQSAQCMRTRIACLPSGLRHRRGARIWACRLASLLLLLAVLPLPARAAITLTDDSGQVITFAAPPQRIVSLSPALTELTCALGACDRLVGIDDFSNWPASVRGLPRLGGLEDASVERILALRPDVVLLAGSTRATPRLQALGLKVVALEPRTLAALERVIGQLDPLLATGRGPALWNGLQQQLDALARELPPQLRGTRVYFEVNDAPYAASESSFIGELLARLGLANVVPGGLGPFPKLNPEFVVRADPQVIMVSDRRSGTLDQRPGWSRMQALRQGRVCQFTPEQGDVMVRAGPRVVEAARLMVDCVRRHRPAGAPR